MSQMWTMKLTASTNFCYISDIKETFMGNNGFLANVYLLNGLESGNERPIA